MPHPFATQIGWDRNEITIELTDYMQDMCDGDPLGVRLRTSSVGRRVKKAAGLATGKQVVRLNSAYVSFGPVLTA